MKQMAESIICLELNCGLEKVVCIIIEKCQLQGKSILENRLKQRSGPTYLGPDLDSSMLAILQKTGVSVSLNAIGLIVKL